MSDIFFSYVEADRELVSHVAAGLEKAGYTTWYYDRDSPHGIPSAQLIPGVINAAQAVIVVISKESLSASRLDRELGEAHRAGKQLIPLLRGLTHFEFRRKRPEWALMLGAGVLVTVPALGGDAAVTRIVAVLAQLRVIRSSVTRSRPRAVALGSLAPQPRRPSNLTTMAVPALLPLPKPQSSLKAGVAGPSTTAGRTVYWPSAPSQYSTNRETLEKGRGKSSRRVLVASFLGAVAAVGSTYWFTVRGKSDGAPAPTPSQTTTAIPMGQGSLRTPTNEESVEQLGAEETSTQAVDIRDVLKTPPRQFPYEASGFTITTSGANLLDGPGVDFEIIETLLSGIEVDLTGDSVMDADGTQWMEISVVGTELTGWVNAEYLKWNS